MVRDSSTSALESFGYTVLAGRERPKRRSRSPSSLDREIDLLMTDVVMPGMNGRQVAERLVGMRPDLGVLFTSGYPSDTILRHGIADARAVFIEKPYLVADLARKVREILDQGHILDGPR